MSGCRNNGQMRNVSRNMRILVMAAHPDDEVLGCGGTISKLCADGAEAAVAIFGEGVTSRYQTKDEGQVRELQDIKSHAYEASKILGVKELTFLDLPDNMFDTVPLLTVVKHCEDLLKVYSPDVVFTHSMVDLNIDHQILARAVITATRPCTSTLVPDVLAFEVPSSTEWSFGQLNGNFNPNVFVDITDHLDKKIQSLMCYITEVREYPHPCSAEGLRIIANRWGTACGCLAAEAFQLVRAIR